MPANATFTGVEWPKDPKAYNAAAGMPVAVVGPSSPIVTVRAESRWGFPADPVLPIDDVSVEATLSDRDLIVVAGTTVYNFWQYRRTGPNAATANAWAMCDVVTDTGFALTSPIKGAGTRAMGASLLGGLIMDAEVKSGSIDHAIALSATDTMLRPGFVAPAVATDIEAGSGPLQEGEYLAIPRATPAPPNLSKAGVILFKALQEFGLYVVDVATEKSTLSLDAAFSDDAARKLASDAGEILPLLQKVNR